MTDVPKSEGEPALNLDIEKCSTIITINPDYRQPPPPYYQQQPQSGRYYYPDQSYYQNQTPAYQQRVGGQNVYVVSGGYPTEPPNVSRGQPAYVVNYPGSHDDSSAYRDSRIFTSTFDTIAIRNRFVQRVYTILSFQLLFSFGFIFLVSSVKELRLFFIKGYLPILLISMLIYLVVMIGLMCCGDLRRQFPINFILLGILTVAFTMMLSCLVATSISLNVVLAAMGTTALVCFAVSIFACQTQWDVTGCGMCLCIGMFVLMLYGLIIMILALCGINMKVPHIIYSAIAVVLFSFWLMYDTQQIMGGRGIELSEEEYITGALCLYIDIMYIFMHLLTLFQVCLGGE